MKLTLRQARNIREIPQVKMAEMLGVHVNTYRCWEEDPDSVEVGAVKKISKILDISYDIIFFDANSTISSVVKD